MDIVLDRLQLMHLPDLEQLGYTQAEMHVFSVGPGKLKLNMHDVPQVGKRMVQQVLCSAVQFVILGLSVEPIRH